MTQFLVSPSGLGGHFDLLLGNGDTFMGFLTARPGMVRQVNNTAPNINTGGMSQHGDESFQQHIFPGFEMGGDKEFFENGENRYFESDGNVALHQSGRVTLDSQWSSAAIDGGDPSVAATAPQIVDFNVGNKYIVVGVGTKVRAYNTTGAAWADSGAFGTDVVYLFANDEYLFAACTANLYRWDGATATTTWTALAFATSGLGWYNATLYRFTGRTIVPATNNNGSAWGAAVNVGYATTNILDIGEALGLLFIAKPEGLYSYDGTTVKLVIDARTIRSTLNFGGFMEYKGTVIYKMLTTVYKAAGISGGLFSAVSEINTDMRGNKAREQYGHGTPIIFFNGPRRAYFAFNGEEGLYPVLLSYNGLGLHKVYQGTSVTTTGYSSDITGGGTASASTEAAGQPASKAVDNLNAGVLDAWVSNGATTGWWKYDLGAGNQAIVTRVLISSEITQGDRCVRNGLIEGSVDNSSWFTLYTINNETAWGSGETRTFTFANTIAYRYWRITISQNDGDATNCALGEVELKTSIQAGDTMHAAGYSPLMGWLLVNDGSTRRKRILNASDEPYPDAAASGSFTMPYIDGGWPDAQKWYKSIELELQDASLTETVTVKYKMLPTDSFTTAATLTTNGRQEIFLGQLDALPRGKKICIGIDMARGADVTKRPKIIGDIILRLKVAPEPVDGIDDIIILDMDMPLRNSVPLKLGSPGVYTRAQINNFLDDLRITDSPITRIDEWGFVTNVQSTDRADTPNRVDAGAPSRQKSFRTIKLLDSYTGFKRDLFYPVEVSVSVELFSMATGGRMGDGTRMGESYMGY